MLGGSACNGGEGSEMRVWLILGGDWGVLGGCGCNGGGEGSEMRGSGWYWQGLGNAGGVWLYWGEGRDEGEGLLDTGGEWGILGGSDCNGFWESDVMGVSG